MKPKPNHDLYADLVLMVDLFCACIETVVRPTHGSPCHRLARALVDKSGMKPKRKRRRLPRVPNQNTGKLEHATPERNPVWIEIKNGKVVRCGLTGIDNPNRPQSGIALSSKESHHAHRKP